MCYHTYTLDDDGKIASAQIVPPTSQNQPQIEVDLTRVVAANMDMADADLQWRCEQTIRNYDPCISCATHFLKLTVERGRPMADSPLHVGIGNGFRTDDGVGPWIAEALGKRGCRAHVHAGDGAGLIDLFAQHDDIVLIDATHSGAPAGTLVTFDARHESLPAEFFHYSTHRFALAEAVEIARHLGMLPRKLMVYGIEGATFEAGTSLSGPVRAAAGELVERLAGTSRSEDAA